MSIEERWLAFLFCCILALIVLLFALPSHARDLDGRYANSPLKPWFDSLHSGRGPCCSDADGLTLSDVEWETKEGHYRVRVPANPMMWRSGEAVWVDVPDDAVITEPNKAGRTIVWPMYRDGLPQIRCFIPGSMS